MLSFLKVDVFFFLDTDISQSCPLPEQTGEGSQLKGPGEQGDGHHRQTYQDGS